MYNLLIVDDEPLICQGLSSLLASSGISIDRIYTAHSGYEALDYLRMEQIDLLITDIQMGSMSGIELMQQAKIIKPWVQVIVISAYETFQYAQQAMRLGAKDYLIKPLNSEQLLASVRHVLLHMDKSGQAREQLMSQLGDNEHFHMQAPLPERDRLLGQLAQADSHAIGGIIAELGHSYNTTISGPYFAVMKLKLDSSQKLKGRSDSQQEEADSNSGGSKHRSSEAAGKGTSQTRPAAIGAHSTKDISRISAMSPISNSNGTGYIADASSTNRTSGISHTSSAIISERKASLSTAQDERLLHYAALNIASELLDQQWDHCIYEEGQQRIAILIQWNEAQYGESSVDKVNQLEMIGRSLQHNIEKYLGLTVIIGISQIFKGLEFMNEVYAQAEKALAWSRRFQDHYVFYYGDFKWDVYGEREPDEEEITAQNNMIVERCRTYIDQNYGQKGLTLNEIAQKNHVSPNYLSYLFKKISGYNLWEYVVKLRMEESKRLLLQTDLRRYEIAERVGYESPEHFSKIFKKYYGVSPSEMKK